MTASSRLERVARAIIRHADKERSPARSVVEELSLTLEFLDRLRAATAEADHALEQVELDVGSALLRLHYEGPSPERARLTERLQDVQAQRRRVRFELYEHERRLQLELLRLVNTHELL